MEITILPALLLILPSLAFGQQCSIAGECLGFSLDTKLPGSERECLNHCRSLPLCQWYNYAPINGFCNTLGNCDGVDESCLTCSRGQRECVIEPMCFETGECRGSFVDHIRETSAEKCLRRCHDDYPTCEFFSFHSDGNLCNLYGTCPFLNRTEAGAVSGERDCYQRVFKGPSKIFTQQYYNTSWFHMPSIRESNATGTTCSRIPSYPLDTIGAAGQVIDGSVTICGGFMHSSSCYSLNVDLNVWVEFESMNVGRRYAASAMTPEGWWVGGGTSDSSGILSSTSLWNGTAWKFGPILPGSRTQFCMAQVNSSHTFMTSGLSNSAGYLSDAYLYDWSNEAWIPLPDVKDNGDKIGCTHYIDSQGGEHILVVGGYPDESSVQSLDLSNPAEWQVLPDLPTSVEYGTFLQDGDDLILLNPYSDNLMRFDESSQKFSIIQEHVNSFLPVGFVVLAVNDTSLNGCR